MIETVPGASRNPGRRALPAWNARYPKDRRSEITDEWENNKATCSELSATSAGLYKDHRIEACILNANLAIAAPLLSFRLLCFQGNLRCETYGGCNCCPLLSRNSGCLFQSLIKNKYKYWIPLMSKQKKRPAPQEVFVCWSSGHFCYLVVHCCSGSVMQFLRKSPQGNEDFQH